MEPGCFDALARRLGQATRSRRSVLAALVGGTGAVLARGGLATDRGRRRLTICEPVGGACGRGTLAARRFPPAGCCSGETCVRLTVGGHVGRNRRGVCRCKFGYADVHGNGTCAQTQPPPSLPACKARRVTCTSDQDCRPGETCIGWILNDRPLTVCATELPCAHSDALGDACDPIVSPCLPYDPRSSGYVIMTCRPVDPTKSSSRACDFRSPGAAFQCCYREGDWACDSDCDCCGDLICEDTCQKPGLCQREIGGACGDRFPCCGSISANCVEGRCVKRCVPPWVACGNNCVNLATDPNNCGACGQPCGAGQSCVGGACCAKYGQACSATMPCCDGAPCDQAGTGTCHYP